MNTPVETNPYIQNPIKSDIDFSHPTYRSPGFYFSVFGYGERGENLHGLKVLDVGEGFSDFAEVINKSRLAEVVAIDPKYRSKLPINSKGGAIVIPDYKETTMAGTAQYLPFRDGAFDEVVASYSLYWIDIGLYHALAEMLRVVKEGGKIRIFPAMRKSDVPYYKQPDEIELVDRPNPESSAVDYRTLEITKIPGATRGHRIRALSWVVSHINFQPGRTQFGYHTDSSGSNIAR